MTHTRIRGGDQDLEHNDHHPYDWLMEMRRTTARSYDLDNTEVFASSLKKFAHNVQDNVCNCKDELI